jgi:hypothetical protein
MLWREKKVGAEGSDRGQPPSSASRSAFANSARCLAAGRRLRIAGREFLIAKPVRVQPRLTHRKQSPMIISNRQNTVIGARPRMAPSVSPHRFSFPPQRVGWRASLSASRDPLSPPSNVVASGTDGVCGDEYELARGRFTQDGERREASAARQPVKQNQPDDAGGQRGEDRYDDQPERFSPLALAFLWCFWHSRSRPMNVAPRALEFHVFVASALRPSRARTGRQRWTRFRSLRSISRWPGIRRLSLDGPSFDGPPASPLRYGFPSNTRRRIFDACPCAVALASTQVFRRAYHP